MIPLPFSHNYPPILRINRFPTNRSLTTDDLSARLLPLKIVLSRFNPDIMKIQANTNSGSIRMSIYLEFLPLLEQGGN